MQIVGHPNHKPPSSLLHLQIGWEFELEGHVTGVVQPQGWGQQQETTSWHRMLDLEKCSPKVGALVPCFSALVEWWFYAKGKQPGKLLENKKCPTTEIRKTRVNQNDDTKSWQVPTTHRCSLALVSRFVPRIDFQAPRCNRRSRSTKDLKLLQHLPATVED